MRKKTLMLKKKKKKETNVKGGEGCIGKFPLKIIFFSFFFQIWEKLYGAYNGQCHFCLVVHHSTKRISHV